MSIRRTGVAAVVMAAVIAGAGRPTTAPMAIRMEVNDSRSGTISPRGDVDLYEITITKPGVFQFSVRDIPDEIRRGKEIAQLHMILEGPGDFKWSKFTTDQKRSFQSEPFDLPVGTYRLKIKDYFDDAASMEPYTVQTSFTEAADAGEPNDTPASATPLRSGVPVRGCLFPRSDIDTYRMDLVTPGRVTVRVSDIPPEVREGLGIKALYLAILDQERRVLREFFSRPRDATLDAPEEVMNAGTYYVVVRDFNADNFSASPYTLVANFPGVKGTISAAERELLDAVRAHFEKTGALDDEERKLLERLEARFLED